MELETKRIRLNAAADNESTVERVAEKAARLLPEPGSEPSSPSKKPRVAESISASSSSQHGTSSSSRMPRQTLDAVHESHKIKVTQNTIAWCIRCGNYLTINQMGIRKLSEPCSGRKSDRPGTTRS